MGESDTEELRIQQAAREREERRAAEQADLPTEVRTHERRANKHEYLNEKLAEREESERDG
jgi:hypothetical protein